MCIFQIPKFHENDLHSPPFIAVHFYLSPLKHTFFSVSHHLQNSLFFSLLSSTDPLSNNNGVFSSRWKQSPFLSLQDGQVQSIPQVSFHFTVESKILVIFGSQNLLYTFFYGSSATFHYKILIFFTDFAIFFVFRIEKSCIKNGSGFLL